MAGQPHPLATERDLVDDRRELLARLADSIRKASLDQTGMNHYFFGMKATVSEKGQVTIPKPLRTRLGIRPGAILEFEEEAGRLVARKAQAGDPVDAAWGILDLGEPVDTFIARTRGR